MLTELIPAKKADISNHEGVSVGLHIPASGYRLDIRGKKPEEAELEVIRFLDEAYASNNSKVEILHGKGTGVLKEMVHNILKDQHYVNNFYFAQVEFGGEGITIVELK